MLKMKPTIGKEFEKYFIKEPIIVADIGARGGVQERWKTVDKKFIKMLGFEPDEEEYKRLVKISKKQFHIEYFNCALHNKNAEVDFYITRNPNNSSILPPNSDFWKKFPDTRNYGALQFDLIKKSKIQTKTLDDVLKESNIPNVDFLKIDTQGSELYILQGAIEIIKKSVFGIEVEVEFTHLYKDQPLFSNVDIFLRRLGFELFDLRIGRFKKTIGKDIGGIKGQIHYADALYLKDFNKYISGTEDKLLKNKALKSIAICICYGYFDNALEICEEVKNRGILKKEEVSKIEKRLRRNKHISTLLPIPNFRGKNRIVSIFYYLYELFRENSPRDNGAYSYLGNDRFVRYKRK